MAPEKRKTGTWASSADPRGDNTSFSPPHPGGTQTGLWAKQNRPSGKTKRTGGENKTGQAQNEMDAGGNKLGPRRETKLGPGAT